MHKATCPTCGTTVELDFRPVAGLIWCPTCQKTFPPPVGPVPDERSMPDDGRKNGKGSAENES
jgi:hypothetical protein